MSLRRVKAVLLVEDNRGDARLLREMLNEEGSSRDIELTHVSTMLEAEIHLSTSTVDVILLDLGLPDAQGLDAVQRAQAAAPRVPLVVLTGRDDEAMALQVLKEGAQDYLIKGQIETRSLLRALHYAIERNNLDEALFAEKERAEVTLNCIGDAVGCTDSLGRVTYLNPVAEKMTGWSSQDARNQQAGEVFRLRDANTRESIRIPTGVALGQDPSPELPSTCILVRRDTQEASIENSIAPIHDRAGRATGAVIVLRDVTALRAMSLKLEHSAQHDFLTGLPNRMLLNDRIARATVLAQRHAKHAAVLFLDLDGFKHINDSLGHPVGDKLLQSIGKRLVECGRASDTVSRQGGDEFVVLLSEIHEPEEAAIAANRMLKAVAETHTIDGHELHVSTSIGVSIFPDDGRDADTLIKNADTAMYQAKENGRQGFQYFKPAMNARAVERRSIEEGLRRALDRQEFSLHYQPKIDFKTQGIVGAEALIRWAHPVRGLVPPATFIPVAEACGLISTIGSWVLRQACTQARAWADAGLPAATMAVNVSAMEFRHEHFLKNLFAILDETGLDPRLLEVELTESVLMKDPEAAGAILAALRRKGVQVALDDFGTGYSSLSYLKKFKIDALKIDQSFVGEIASAGDDASIVSAVIGMARSLHLRVIAEGVETLEQLKFLQNHDCDEAQGYYFSRPVVPQQFAVLLRDGIQGVQRAAPFQRTSRT